MSASGLGYRQGYCGYDPRLNEMALWLKSAKGNRNIFGGVSFEVGIGKCKGVSSACACCLRVVGFLVYYCVCVCVCVCVWHIRPLLEGVPKEVFASLLLPNVYIWDRNVSDRGFQ